jgi:hypothetical protein
MELKEHTQFLINLNEEEKSYSLLMVDWESKRMNIIERFDNSDDDEVPNLLLKKAWIRDGDIDDEISLFNGETDEEFYEISKHLKTLPHFNQYKEQIISEFSNI